MTSHSSLQPIDPEAAGYDPWRPTGARPRISHQTISDQGKSQHHKRTKASDEPFGLLHAQLDIVPHALYDTLVVGPKGWRDSGELQWRPEKLEWRAYLNVMGKTERDMSPFITGGGSLPPPRIFDARRISCIYQVAPSWLEPAIDDASRIVKVRRHVDTLDVGRMRADVQVLKSALQFRFCVHIKEYACGPLTELPAHLNVYIPPQTVFYAPIDCPSFVSVCKALHYVWRLIVRAEGFLGIEVM